MSRFVIVAAATVVFSVALFGQTFEVVSVKPSDGHQGIDMKTYPNRLLATSASLHQLIEAAYSMERWQVTGGPAWLASDRFDIEARTAEDFSNDTDRVSAFGRPAPRKMMVMLQALLADRFGVKVHRETREDNVYALVVAKGGPKLKASTGDQHLPVIFAPPSRLLGQGSTMAGLARALSLTMHGPVIDETGVGGTFDFTLTYAPQAADVDAGPSIFTALQEQMGLRLESRKSTMDVLVVDHLDRVPAEN